MEDIFNGFFSASIIATVLFLCGAYSTKIFLNVFAYTKTFLDIFRLDVLYKELVVVWVEL